MAGQRPGRRTISASSAASAESGSSLQCGDLWRSRSASGVVSSRGRLARQPQSEAVIAWRARQTRWPSCIPQLRAHVERSWQPARHEALDVGPSRPQSCAPPAGTRPARQCMGMVYAQTPYATAGPGRSRSPQRCGGTAAPSPPALSDRPAAYGCRRCLEATEICSSGSGAAPPDLNRRASAPDRPRHTGAHGRAHPSRTCWRSWTPVSRSPHARPARRRGACARRRGRFCCTPGPAAATATVSRAATAGAVGRNQPSRRLLGHHPRRDRVRCPPGCRPGAPSGVIARSSGRQPAAPCGRAARRSPRRRACRSIRAGSRGPASSSRLRLQQLGRLRAGAARLLQSHGQRRLPARLEQEGVRRARIRWPTSARRGAAPGRPGAPVPARSAHAGHSASAEAARWRERHVVDESCAGHIAAAPTAPPAQPRRPARSRGSTPNTLGG